MSCLGEQHMANKKERLYSSEGSGSLGRVIDTGFRASENPSGFNIPIKALQLSKMSRPELEDLALHLTAELEQIRALQKKVEARQKHVTFSSSRDITVATPGPQKMRNWASKKGRITNWATSRRFSSAKQPNFPKSLMTQCQNLLKKLMSHKYGKWFSSPVDIVEFKIPDYFDVIKYPMDLGTIKGRLAKFEYSSPLDFVADVRLTFSNAMTYNPPGNEVHVMADSLSKNFEARWMVIEKLLNVYQPLPEETNKVMPMSTAKKRKISATQHEVVAEPDKRIMTDKEKYELQSDLECLSENLPDNIEQFLLDERSIVKEAGEDDELAVDINVYVLGDDVLLKLRKLLDDHLHKIQNNAKDESCDMEMLNESGVTNSSLQLNQGNETIDEDVDIGGNEPPASSYPPLEIQKDSALGSNKCISPGSSNESDSDSDSDSDSSSSSDSESDV